MFSDVQNVNKKKFAHGSKSGNNILTVRKKWNLVFADEQVNQHSTNQCHSEKIAPNKNSYESHHNEFEEFSLVSLEMILFFLIIR